MVSCEDRYAEILAKAVGVFGSEDEARRWMVEPAIGLNHQVPAMLCQTDDGAELVDTYLNQIEYGVYV